MYHYLDSDKIAVFPSSTRDTQQSRLITESRLASFVRNSIDSKGFVVSYDDDTKIIEFYLMGYYFVCDISDLTPLSDNQSLYATIEINRTQDTAAQSGTQDTPINSGLYDSIVVYDTQTPPNLILVGFDTTAPDSSTWSCVSSNDDTNKEDAVWQQNGESIYRLKLLTAHVVSNTTTYVANTNHFKVNKANNVVIVANQDGSVERDGRTINYTSQTEIINIDCGTL